MPCHCDCCTSRREVECSLCQKILPRSKTVKVDPETGSVCKDCISELVSKSQ